MKKLIKLFSLIGVFTLCLGMTLLTTNKTNVKAQTEVSATVYFPLPSGFYLYDFANDTRLYFLYNSADTGGSAYSLPYTFMSSVLTGEIQQEATIKNLRESYLINDKPYIKEELLSELRKDATIAITVRPFFVFDISTWFETVTLGLDLSSIQYYTDTTTKRYINNDNFNDLKDLAEIQLNLFGIDLSNAISDNTDIDVQFYFDFGWNRGRDDARSEFGKFVDGNWLTADEYANIVAEDKDIIIAGLQDQINDLEQQLENFQYGPIDYFLLEFNNWVIPAIAVAVFGGGLFMLFSRKREV